jgi:hypothetical protein
VSQPNDRRPFDRQVRFGRILGLFFCVAGFLAIGFGWNGMAKVACADCQLPYLLSGGAAGIGLILLGVGLMVMAQVRDERTKLADQLRQVGTVLSRAATGGQAAGSGQGERVVAGTSTYHRPDCRLIKGRNDLDLLTVDVARLNGLSPCRVCDPPAGESANSKGEQTLVAASEEASTEEAPSEVPQAGAPR